MVEVRSIAPLGAAPPVGGDHARVDPASPVPLPTAAPRIPVRRRRRGRWTRARLRRSRDRRRDAPPAHGLASAGSGGLGDRARRARDDGKPLVRPLPGMAARGQRAPGGTHLDRKSTRLNSSHTVISYAVFCLKKKNKKKVI